MKIEKISTTAAEACLKDYAPNTATAAATATKSLVKTIT